ncbi:hypothetical protein DPMN_071683 [Dreissena polymorpha]|uniref:Uncharacterized protein n=1 Tax=Dreissena polymorpha TaxID=45954 RepID=A0A9D4BPW0_DREPO|nr:hypothetical protein DPMN_071683 [Dreissena polymorpha]
MKKEPGDLRFHSKTKRPIELRVAPHYLFSNKVNFYFSMEQLHLSSVMKSKTPTAPLRPMQNILSQSGLHVDLMGFLHVSRVGRWHANHLRNPGNENVWKCNIHLTR